MSKDNSLINDILKGQENIDKVNQVQLVTSDNSDELINNLLSSNLPDKLKAFSLMNAKAELVRIIKLTDALNELEETYINRALDDKDGMDMDTLRNTIDTVTKSLDRSIKAVNNITNSKNNNLMLSIDQSSTTNNITNNNVNVIDNKVSRDKLRNLASRMLNDINKENVEDAEYVKEKE